MGNTITMENGLEVTGATLLTAEEAERLPKKTSSIGYDWWLRSPGEFRDTAVYVDSDGPVSYNGDLVINDNAVRPALELSALESSNLTIGDSFLFGKKEFEIISADRALCAESIGKCVFCGDWKADNVNDYESSDIKKFVDSWYQGIILQLSQKKEKSKIENRNNVTLENGLEVTGATLLTDEEVGKLPEETLVIGEWWWLCSPGYYSYDAAHVISDGSVSYIGHGVCSTLAVRPALKLLNLKSSNLQIGDQFWFGGKEFKIISDTHALCTEGIGHCAFRKNWKAKDANDYESSDIKKFVDSWYQGIILQLSQKKEKSKIENQNNVTLENGLEVTGATLLTAEEAGKITKETLEIDDSWWLRSRGIISHTVIVINSNSNGSICYGGDYVFRNNAIRPALIIQTGTSGLRTGDAFRFGGKEFEIVSDTRALCTDIIGKSVFRENWEIRMRDSDDYEASDVKKIVDNWYRNAVNEVSQTDTTEKEKGGQQMDKKTNISVHDAIGAVTRCGKTKKEREKEQLRECVKNCIGIIDRMILEEAAKGNEQITIVRGDLRREISEDFYDTFVNADFRYDIIPLLVKHYRKKHFRCCTNKKPYPVCSSSIEICWEKNPVKRFFSVYGSAIFPLLLFLYILFSCIVFRKIFF